MDSDSEKHVNIYPSGTIQNLQVKKCLTHFMEVLKSMQNLPTIFCPWHPRKAMAFLAEYISHCICALITIMIIFYNTANAEIRKNQRNFMFISVYNYFQKNLWL